MAAQGGKMKGGKITNCLLLTIALALIAIALRPLRQPVAAQAQQEAPYPFYIEPGVQMLRSPDGTTQVYGRMIVDMRNGTVWGFPTLTSAPYPVDIDSTKPPVSHPFLLGTFAFSDVNK